MDMNKAGVPADVIESFLNGNNPKKYVVAIEANYNDNYVNLIVNYPDTGKKIEKHKFSPFLWFKEEVLSIIYEGQNRKIIDAKQLFDVKIKPLRTSDENGNTPKRLENGYKYIATCKKSYNNLIKFFKDGGVDLFDSKYSKLFFMFSPVEQFMIQTGIRLFKGIEDYNDLHRFQFDLETEGLSASNDSIFQIGMRDNRGFEHVLETTGETLKEKRDSERKNLKIFFKIIDHLKPDIISGYNSESFDWKFIVDRCERLGLNLNSIALTLDESQNFKRKKSMLKLGNEMESFEQTYMYGYNVIDIAHSVRRAQAINSDIKSWGLKYITKYSDIAKPNRVYVQGDKIHSTWSDIENKYAFNDTNGDWYKISEKNHIKENYEEVDGAYIVRRYLLDDLWETEQIDTIFNQASFLISKLLPTTYSRSSTMGTASQWKLIMSAWSYENGLAIPETENKRDFTGGLSRLLELGYAKNVVKLDYAALYPKNQLTHEIFPDLDISGVMKGILTYVVDTRDKFKFLTGEHKGISKKLTKKIDSEKDSLSKEELSNLKEDLKKNKALANLYDKKQLPLKILANSWFGAYGAPYIFNWGDSDCAEETTCRGRQYLRLMVKHFSDKYGFKPLVGDSVTYDTPVYIRYNNGDVDVKPICDLFNEDSDFIDKEKLRDFEQKPYEVLTVNGWKKINYVFRHGTDKEIHRVITKDRLVQVTEDHSLFQNNQQIKPSILKRGDKIDVYHEDILNHNLCDISLDKAWLMGFFLGDGSAIYGPRKQYYKSKKTGNINTNKGTRGDWKISNTNLKFLEKLKDIVEREFFVKAEIKNHLKSSGVYNLVVTHSEFAKYFSDYFYTSYREKKIPVYIFNSNKEIKKAFLNGVFASDGYGNDLEGVSDIGMKSQVAMAGLSIILKSLNIDYKIRTRKDKQNFISFKLKNRNRNNSSFTNKTKMKSDEVWKNDIIINTDKNKYVYDISTDDGTFIGGIGMINLKNTDGFNFAFPDNINDVKYVAKGSHWKTEKDANKELVGLDAVLAEFNENYMTGRMGLDIDDICNSTINFSRKNYANDIGGKIKFVGNSIKSKKMPVYIEEFLDKGIRLLLDGKGKEFINYYYEYVDKIYSYNIPIVKIASKSKVKTGIKEYKQKANQKNKAGNPMPKQAHMELAMRDNLNISLGDTLYYFNTGSSKNEGDIKTLVKSKMSKKELQDYFNKNGHYPKSDVEVLINCKLIDPMVFETNMETIKEIETLKKVITQTNDEDKIDELKNNISKLESQLITEDYNVAKYLEAFNKKVKPLLVCFHTDIRNKILLNIKKDKKTNIEKLDVKNVFSDSQCVLVSGMPNNSNDQDTYDELMTMEDKEIKFWVKVNKIPNNIESEEWEKNLKKRLDNIEEEKENLKKIFSKLEVDDFSAIRDSLILPSEILYIATVNDDAYFISRKWNEVLCSVSDMFEYELEAIERNKWYISENVPLEGRYDLWLEYKSKIEIKIEKNTINNLSLEQINILKDKIKVVNLDVPKKDNSDDSEDDSDENINYELDDNFISELQKIEYEQEFKNEVISVTKTDDDYTKDLLKNIMILPKDESDEWNF
jgi:DNA polymerase elongation subunit (family B)